GQKLVHLRCFCRGNPLWLPISRAATGGRPYNVCPRLPKKPPLLGCAARGWARVAVQFFSAN
ncbi:MAG: hypothetical protein SWH68_00035, partial [Thermodesulfobacteriota bacterium]|nr:hypothetical protein [Thermodesulfobacteriota bacterium]